MAGSKRMFFYRFLMGIVLVGLSGCGGSIDEHRAEPATGGSGTGTGVTSGTGAVGGLPNTSTGGNEPTGTGGDEPYIEPECPDEEPPPAYRECDPLDPYGDCPDGTGCYPYLEYPFGERCGQPAFGAICVPASSGEQGDFCGDNGDYCSPGFMCVVGATGGKRCGKICVPVRDHACPTGLVCGETDVQGYGVCF